MATRVRDLLMGQLGELRFEPIDKRIRGMFAGRTVIDTTRAMVVWEPKRVVPTYGVPVTDIDGQLVSAPRAAHDVPIQAPQLGQHPVYDPSIPFSVHTADGESLSLRTGGAELDQAAFAPADAALSGYVIVDFNAFDAWYEEDEPNVAHPRDPFHRIDIVHSSRHVRVRRDGKLLAESTSPCLLFEPPLPVRYYLPPEGVLAGALVPSETKTFCAYKGQASYWALDGQDLAWSYQLLREAVEVTDRIAFFNEHVDRAVEGIEVKRPVTPWSSR
jgi:uncharacterized protein (DUF427 family)